MKEGANFQHRYTNDQRLDFLYTRISMTKEALSYLLQIPEFSNKMLNMIDGGGHIDDMFVYRAIVEIISDSIVMYSNGVKIPYSFSSVKRQGRLLAKKIGIEPSEVLFYKLNQGGEKTEE